MGFYFILVSHLILQSIISKNSRKYMKLVIAEKPSVAMSIAKVIGARQRKDVSYKNIN